MNTVYTFNQHEYLFLLGLLKPQTVLGIAQPYATSEEAQAAMLQALDSLQAQGHIARNQGEITLNPRIEPLVSACASPRYSLVATYTNAQKEQDIRFYHVSEQAIVEDRLLPSADRQLIGADTLDQVAERLAQQFHLGDQPAAPGQPFALPSPAMDAIRQSGAMGEEDIAARLRQAGASDSNAVCLARALAHLLSNSAMAKVNATEAASPDLDFGILESADGLWEIRLSEQVSFAPTSAAAIKQQIAGYIS